MISGQMRRVFEVRGRTELFPTLRYRLSGNMKKPMTTLLSNSRDTLVITVGIATVLVWMIRRIVLNATVNWRL